ncbi:hypothetical protein Pgy4_13811, partial [Pseudomonas savastanoi pv. glycinea str. race 4]
ALGANKTQLIGMKAFRYWNGIKGFLRQTLCFQTFFLTNAVF